MVMFFGTVYLVCAWAWVQLIPGWIVSRWLVSDAVGGERAGIALLCAWSIVPLAFFLVAVMAAVPMDSGFLWFFSTAINVLGLLDRRNRVALRLDWRYGLGFLCLALGVGVLLALGYRSLDGGDVFSTVHHCLYVIVMHTITNDPSVAVPLYDAASDGIVHYLVHHQTGQFNGLAPLFFEQRLGNAPILAPSVALFGTAGWWWASATTGASIAVYSYLVARALSISKAASGMAAFMFTLGMHNFCMYFVNENTYAVTLTAVLLWAALIPRRTTGWLILLGIAAGHLLGVRYTSALILPAVALAALWRSEAWLVRWKRFSVGLVAFSITILPWLYVNSIMLDSPLTHPKIHAEHEGRVVTNTFLGTEFEFRALNWPFIEEWSRTAWNPFPTQVWLPLQLGQSFGQLAIALALLGVFALWRRRREFWLLVVFCLPHTLAICWLETLDWEQLTYAAPGLVPLVAWLALGIDKVLSEPKRQTVLVFISLAVVFGTANTLQASEWPVDRRMLARVDTPERVMVPDGRDHGTALVSEWLTQFRLLPQLPVVRTTYANALTDALSHIPMSEVETSEHGPVYPSGRVAVLAGYSQFEDKSYDFVLEGAPLLTTANAIRTSLGLHQVSLRMAAERLQVSLVRRQGRYVIDIKPLKEAVAEQDFTFWLHPWMPPIERIDVTANGKPIPDLRSLEYGGTQELDQLRFILTNYSSEIHDIVEMPYVVRTSDEDQVQCGLFLFLGDGSDPAQLETLVLAGGHDTFWLGKPEGTLNIPRNLAAKTLVLYTDPTCSTHVPQPGDKWAVAHGPFTDELITLELGRYWLPN